MTKYLVATRAAIVVEADNPMLALQYCRDIEDEIAKDYSIIFDTANDTLPKELFD